MRVTRVARGFAAAVAAAIAATGGLTSAASGQRASASTPATEAPRQSGATIAGQVGAGIAGTALGFIGAGLLARSAASALGHDEEGAGRIGLIGAYAGAAALTAVGPALVGSRGDARGSYPAALGGAVLGGGVSYALVRLGRAGAFGERGPRAVLAGLVIVAAPSIGATVAFNATRERSR
jgi:hypothetical protein